MRHVHSRSTLISMVVLVAAMTADAQFFDKSDKQSSSSLLAGQNPMLMQSQARPSVLDGPVDAKMYTVGPGDQFALSVWSGIPLNINVTVNPEGTVIIPTVGEFFISGTSLDDSKKTVIAAVGKKYTASQISFTLVVPRSFTVVVKGTVLREGKQIVQATDRADEAVALANTILAGTKSDPADRQKLSPSEEVYMNASQRRIDVFHKDGTVTVVDLERYYALHDFRFNPYLRDGDVITVPRKNLAKNYFSISGAVNRHGVKEFFAGDNLSLAISMAGGTTALVDSSNIQVTRYNSNGNSSAVYHTSVGDIVRDGGMLLQRGDQIVVGEKLELRRNHRVYIEGEVNAPGDYPITKDSTTLSMAIAFAKGFTYSASLKNSRLYRRTVSEKDIQDERLESARGGYTPEDSSYYFLETNIRINREQVPVNFEELFGGNNTAIDVYVKDGDLISVGSKIKTIYIFGQVLKPGHYTFSANKNTDQFIAEAGGYTSEAREGDLRIIKSNTRQWLKPSETVLEEGDYIWVPKEPYRPGSYYLSQFSQIFTILGTVATLAVLVVQISK